MKLEIDDKSNPDSITWKFTATKDEIAKCEFTQSTINFIAKLENSPGIADQLEVLLEYFHAIEGTQRVTDLAKYMHYLQQTLNYRMNQGPGNLGGPIYSTASYAMYTSAQIPTQYQYQSPKKQKKQPSNPNSLKDLYQKIFNSNDFDPYNP